MQDAGYDGAVGIGGLPDKVSQIAAHMRQTLTYDQGREMAFHRELALATNMQLYFCGPHGLWQRGSCENTNGLLRQFLPKGSDLSVLDQAALDSIAELMNCRPRQTLDWRSLYQVLREFKRGIDEQQDATIH